VEPSDEASKWYAVRCISVASENKPWGPKDLRNGEFSYEERITLWHTSSHDHAIALAEADAREYAETLEEEYAGIAQSYELPEPPGHGEEVFSLIRLSGLGPDDYITRFFDTGTERQKPVSE
jgi:hypothetical protein